MFCPAGLGLGAIASGIKSISDDMFLVSARSLSQQATAEDLAAGCLFPALENIRAVSAKVRVCAARARGGFKGESCRVAQVAAAVAEFAWDSGAATSKRSLSAMMRSLSDAAWTYSERALLSEKSST